MVYAPIIVFAYKRPQHLTRVLEDLAANDLARECALTIYCDGPKNGASHADLLAIEQVRAVAHAAAGFALVKVVEAPVNKGLARSVIEGVSQALKDNDRVVVVEDDVSLSPFFLRFMNEGLQRYAADTRVWSVGSWSYFIAPGSMNEHFFLRYPDSIAWATWRRSWDRFEQDGRKLAEQLERAGRGSALEADGRVNYMRRMLQDQIDGKVDSWAIRWTVNCVLNGALNLYPLAALSKHAGFGGGATHEIGEGDYNKDLVLAKSHRHVSALAVEESQAALDQWVGFVQQNFTKPTKNALKSRIWRALPEWLRQWYARQRHSQGVSPAQLAFEPISRVFGVDRGKPVDRHYIEQFLQAERELIAGDVMEIAEARYTRQFGAGTVRSSVLSFAGESSPGVIVGDLTRPESLPAAAVDTFICTQTLNFIYDVRKAVEGLHTVLRPGGHALVTVAGICQVSRYDADRWGDHWRFMPGGIERMFQEVFGAEQVSTTVYGNSYAATCLLKGFATEECDTALLDRPDRDYPVVIAIKALRR